MRQSFLKRWVITGTSLLEVATVLAILSIVSAISLPSSLNLIKHIRLQNAIHQINSDLIKAKSYAIAHNHDVIVNFQTSSYDIIEDSKIIFTTKLADYFPNVFVTTTNLTFNPTGASTDDTVKVYWDEDKHKVSLRTTISKN